MRIQVTHRLPLVALLTLAVASGCAVGGGGHDVSSKQLNLYTWTRYVPPSVISGFEKKYGLKVNVTYYASNEQAIAGIKANPGTYDIVIPSDYAVEILRDDDLLETINTTKDLQNFSNIDPSFRSPQFDPGSSLRQIKGKTPEPKYTIPYQWGTTGIAYNDSDVTDAARHLGRSRRPPIPRQGRAGGRQPRRPGRGHDRPWLRQERADRRRDRQGRGRGSRASASCR